MYDFSVLVHKESFSPWYLLFSCIGFTDWRTTGNKGWHRVALSFVPGHVLRTEDGPDTGFDAGGVGLSFRLCPTDYPPTRHRVFPRVAPSPSHVSSPAPERLVSAVPLMATSSHRRRRVTSQAFPYPSPQEKLRAAQNLHPSSSPAPPHLLPQQSLRLPPLPESHKRGREALLLSTLYSAGFWSRGSPSLSLG